MMRAVIDTDIFIDFLHDKTKGEKLFEDIVNEKVIGLVSVVTEVELLSGSECNDAERRYAVDNILSTCHKIEVSVPIAQKAGELRRTCHTPIIDSIIAATAIIANAVVVSRNTKDFSRIKAIELQKPY